jgi:hypothetical protein
MFPFFSLLSLFWKNKIVGWSDHLAVCVRVAPAVIAIEDWKNVEVSHYFLY